MDDLQFIKFDAEGAVGYKIDLFSALQLD